jgi:sporulation protein YlmC with PRC-barrel domain
MMAALAATAFTFNAALFGAEPFTRLEKANEVIGKEVQNKQGDKIGKINDAILDLESGRILYTLISAGGFLGIGDTFTAVPPGLFALTPEQGAYVINAEKQTLANAPRFTREQEERLGNASFVQQIYRHYNQPAWWGGQEQGRFGNVHRASELAGKNVKNVSDQPVGKVETVLMDLPNGRVVYLLLDPAGVVEGDSKLRAIPPNAFTSSADGRMLVLDADKGKLEVGPSAEANNLQQLSNPSYAARVYQYYGKQPYWSGASTASSDRDAAARERTERETAVARRDPSDREPFSSNWSAKRLSNREVKTANGERVGTLDDIVVDLESGHILYALISDGRVLAGKAGRRALASQVFSRVPLEGPLVVNANAQKLTNAPRLTKENEDQLGSVAFVTDVYRHFNQRTWWDGGPSPTGRDDRQRRDKFGHVHAASELAGMKVQNSSGENVGTIEQVMVDLAGGRTTFLLLNVRGLGAGEGQVPVPPMAFAMGTDKKTLVLDADKEKLRNGPQVQRDRAREQFTDPAFVAEVYRHYGKDPYWDTSRR